MKRKARKVAAYINIFVLSTVLTAFGVLFFLQKHGGDSLLENRRLSPMPVYSSDSVLFGHYIDSVDLFVADNFPFREQLVNFSFEMRDARGIKDENIGFLSSKPKPVIADLPVVKSTVDSVKDSVDFTANVPQDGGEEMDNLLYFNGHAMEIFGGNDRMAKAYADVINKYQVALAGKANVYTIVVPSSIEFNAPLNYRGKEKHNIEAMYRNMMAGVNCVDAYSLIAQHQQEYEFFRTDHHWTALGAYYAYVAFCNKAGITPLKLEQMEKKSKPGYLGSLYNDTHDDRLRDNADTVWYWKIPNAIKAYSYNKKSQNKPVAGSLYAEFARGGNSYGVFIGGDFPMVRIDSDVKNGKKVAIIKNSYGNPFSTYFPANYEQTYVVDYRYYDYNLLDLIEQNGITDVIFINGVFSANTSWHLHMMERLMRNPVLGKPQPNSDVKPKQDSVPKADSPLKKIQ